MKDDYIQIRLSKQVKGAYLEYCKKAGTTYSDDIRRHIAAKTKGK